MKKVWNKLFLMLAIFMISLALLVNVNAAEDEAGYEDFDNQPASTSTETNTTENKTEEPKETKTPETNKQENTETTGTTDTKKEETKTEEIKKEDTATSAHAKAGVFENSFFIAATILIALSIGFGYRKLKKYNF